MAPRDTDVVQPKVRLRKALHRRLTAAARANKASLNGEIVRRLEASFLHEALEKRLSNSDPPTGQIATFEIRMIEIAESLRQLTKVVQGSFAMTTKISPAPFDFETVPVVRSRRRLKPATSEKEGEK